MPMLQIGQESISCQDFGQEMLTSLSRPFDPLAQSNQTDMTLDFVYHT